MLLRVNLDTGGAHGQEASGTPAEVDNVLSRVEGALVLVCSHWYDIILFYGVLGYNLNE